MSASTMCDNLFARPSSPISFIVAPPPPSQTYIFNQITAETLAFLSELSSSHLIPCHRTVESNASYVRSLLGVTVAQ